MPERPRRAPDNKSSITGDLLQEIVNRISHRHGETLRIMDEIPVTLQQTLLIRRLREMSPCTASDLAAEFNLSLPAVSQAIDRLVRLKLVTRVASEADRRKKQLATTSKAHLLLGRLFEARSKEYSGGLSGLPADVRKRLISVLREVLRELQWPHHFSEET
jgi:DNA-binding MarR family transcriptional regulator